MFSIDFIDNENNNTINDKFLKLTLSNLVNVMFGNT